MDAFDADALIYAATDAPLGDRVRALFPEVAAEADEPTGIGSVLLLPEVLSKPTRRNDEDEVVALEDLLAGLDLLDVDADIAGLAVDLGAAYGLQTADAVHLATAVRVGASRFITNNKRDFPQSIDEIDITYPEDLPEPLAPFS